MTLPKAFCFNPKKVKAIVLGADPTNQHDQHLEYAFGIMSEEKRFFRDILANLNLIGLHLEDIYVQNLVQDYQNSETALNKDWEKAAEASLENILHELKTLQKEVPVLITAERIMKFLVNDASALPKAAEIYSNNHFWVSKPEENKLNRTLIALYRHQDYNLKVNPNYLNQLTSFFASH